MHNSRRTRYKLGLYMMTSLLAIIIATSFGNESLFSNAIAQEYDYNDDDPYDNNMDNSYGTNYNNYPGQQYPSSNEPYDDKRTSYNYNDDNDNYGNNDYDEYSTSKTDKNKPLIVNPFNCVNSNFFNSNNTGNINIGNNGKVREGEQKEGYLDAYSYDGGRYGSEEYSKQSKGIYCIINNNITNIVIGNGTLPTPPPPTGFLDLAVANYLSDDVSILLQENGNGTFTPATNYPVGDVNSDEEESKGSGPRSVAVGDFNNDEILDLATANENSNSVSILLGMGDGTFAPATSFDLGEVLGAIYVVTGDFNNDGNLDLAVANELSHNVSILLGDGNGSFTEATDSFPLPVDSGPRSVAVGDFNNDTNLDLAVANYESGTVSILLGDGDGSFTESTDSPITVETSPISIAIGDFNDDDMLDLAVANVDSNNVSILLGDGNGNFDDAPDSPITVETFPVSIAVGDLDDDDVLDLAVANGGSSIMSILLGNGDGTFTPTTDFPVLVGSEPRSVVAVDLNNDGNLDLAVANADLDTLSIFLGDGNGAFDPANRFTVPVGTQPLSIAIGDFN